MSDLGTLAPGLSPGPWIAFFAGTCAPSGAEDAWYETALEIELAKLLGTALTGGGADIFKCFDQISLVLPGKILLQGVSLPSYGMHTAPSI